MNSLERSLILKAGYDNGWEVVIEDSPAQVVLASALHRARTRITASANDCRWQLTMPPGPISRELAGIESRECADGERFKAFDEAQLGKMLYHAARLARALPDEPWQRFEEAVAKELATHVPTATEVERLVRQRVGQDIYRESLMDYWGGACAVTGIAIPELLRASHAKPWAECASDAERLNVFNGFLLAAHLDALFDRNLITFSDGGEAIFAQKIDTELRSRLGLCGSIRLRWIRGEHLAFLHYHRAAFERSTAPLQIDVATRRQTSR